MKNMGGGNGKEVEVREMEKVTFRVSRFFTQKEEEGGEGKRRSKKW